MRSRAGAAVRATVVAGALALLTAACGTSATGTSQGGGTTAPPKVITVGTLYSGSGSFATSSLPEYAGLQFWVRHENAKGGVYVKAFRKRIPVKLVSYNDQSSSTTATTLYSQLVTQDHVDLLVSDFGSVLTAAAVTIAQEHHRVLFDQSGTGTAFFTPNNPYIVLCDLPTSAIWPKSLVGFLHAEHITRVAMVYGSNEFDASQANTVRTGLARYHVTPVYDHSVPTATSDYTTIVHSMAAAHPQAVLELGYPPNDIAFLQAVAASGAHFPMTFTAFPGQLHHLIEQNVGQKGMAYTFSYGNPPQLAHNNVTIGLGTTAFETAFAPSAPSSVNFLDVAGYNTGVAIQAALGNASSFTQLSIRSGLAKASTAGMTTIEGNFRLDSEGAQVGELLPVSQMVPSGSTTKIEMVYPPSSATAKAVYPAP